MQPLGSTGSPRWIGRRRWTVTALVALVVTGALGPARPAAASVDRSSAGTGAAAAPLSGAAKTHAYYYIETRGDRGLATGVSDDRLIVGYYIYQNRELPFVHRFDDLEATVQDLPLDRGFANGAALAISPDGSTIVGFETTPGVDPCWAVRWQRQPVTGQYVISRLRAGVNGSSGTNLVIDCSVKGVSALDSGVIYLATDDPGKLLRWENGQIEEITQIVGEVPIPGRTTSANGLKVWNAGNRAWAKIGSQPQYELRRLSETVSNPDAFVSRVSNHREVIGASRLTVTQANGTTADVYHAVRWQDDGTPVDLNTVTAGRGTIVGLDVELRLAVGLNLDGDIVGGAHNPERAGGLFESPMILVALPPIVFVPGVSGSILNEADGDEAWLDIAGDHNDLALTSSDLNSTEPGGIYAARLAAHESFSGLRPSQLAIYGPFIDALQGSGFRSYRETTRANRTTEGCDLSQRSDNPNLFLFPYDWRLPNARTAQRLADFMGCVRKFYTGPVVLSAHSMGGLVSRRYLLDHVPTGPTDPTDSHVRDLVTIGTPWLGAPKFVNVIETGDFVPFLRSWTTMAIVPTMYGPRELLPSEAYYSLVPEAERPFKELGRDYNDNGLKNEVYSAGELNALLDINHPANTDVTATASLFHANPGQDDWRQDPVGIRSTVIYAVQAEDTSIGQVIATTEESCTRDSRCRQINVLKLKHVPGDGTVPMISAARRGEGLDLNDPRRETLIELRAGSDDQLEHVALPGHPQVVEELLRVANRRLPGLSAMAAAAHGPAGMTERSVAIASRLPAAAAASGSGPSTAPNASGGWYVAVSGFDGDPAVTAPDGRSDAGDPAVPAYRPSLFGVHHQATGDESEVTILPSNGGRYVETFTAGSHPLRVEVRRGIESSPDLRATWLDLDVPAGSTVELVFNGDGTVALSYREPGGSTPVAVPPTALVSGALAQTTLTAPELSVTSTIVDGSRRFILSAANGGTSPITQILWTVDGDQFQRYTGPIVIDPDTTTLRAFADDAAGNRSPLAILDLRGAPTGPYTTAAVSPALPASGWSQVPVAVLLHTHASDDTTTRLHHTLIPPAGPAVPTTVDDDVAIVDISSEGRTTVRYHSTDDAGGIEPEHSLQLGIDRTAPTVAIVAPGADSTQGAFPGISGTASDGASGVAAVGLTIQRTGDGKYWNGSAWQVAAIELAATGTTTWAWTGVLPTGANALAGGYTITARATDVAGLTASTRRAFLISSTPTIRELRSPNSGLFLPTLGLGINNSGVASGKWGHPFTCQFCYSAAVTWGTDGAPRIVRDGTTNTSIGFQANGINDAGQAVGSTPAGAAIWEADGTQRTALSTSEGHDINDAVPPVAVGMGSEWGTWTVGGTFAPLPAPPGFTSVIWYQSDHQTAINDAGTVVGTRFVSLPNNAQRYFAAAMATATGASFLFDPSDRVETHAFDINNSGVIVGDRALLAGHFGLSPYSPFVRAADGTITVIDLSGAGLGTGSARSINDAGVIVGDGYPGWPDNVYLEGVPANQRAWIRMDGVVRNLNTFLPPGSGWTLLTAVGINDRGEVVGTGSLNGVVRGYVLSLGGGALEVPPVALDRSAETIEGLPVDVALGLARAPLHAVTWSLVATPAHGSVAIAGATATYTPAPGFIGDDAFEVRAVDGSTPSNVASVRVAVRPAVPRLLPPVAVIDAPAAVPDGTTVTLDGSDSYDPNGFGPLTYAWDLDGDGQPDALTAQATTQLAGLGDHPVALTVTGAGGSATTTAVVAVVASRFEPSPEPQRTLDVTMRVVGDGGAGYLGTYRLDIDCDDGADHDRNASLLSGETLRIVGLPAGAHCEVVEPSLPTLSGYAFGGPIFDPPSGSITIPAAPEGSASITVTNSVTRETGSLRIATSVIGASATFSGSFTYRVICDLDGPTSVATVTYPTATLVPNIPAGTTCALEPLTAPAPPVGFAWDGAVTTGPVTIVAGGTVDVAARHVVGATARVSKTLGGAALGGTQAFTFELRSGAFGPDMAGSLLDAQVANGANGGSITFTSNLVPGQFYQVCEILDVGWRSSIGPSAFALTINGANDRMCTDFEAVAGFRSTFAVDNTPPPGGGARGPGYWKNHASCRTSGGNQTPILDQTLAKFLAPKGQKKPGFFVGKLYVDTCAEAYALLDKSTLLGQKVSDNAAWSFAAQYTAYVLNLKAGAAPNATAAAASSAGQELLTTLGFEGTLPLTMSNAVRASLLGQAAILDRYNNNTLP